MARQQMSLFVALQLFSEALSGDGQYEVGHGSFDVTGYVCEGTDTKIYYPKGEGPFPIVLYAHGSKGYIADAVEDELKMVASFGMTVVAPNTGGADDDCTSQTEWKDIVTVLDAVNQDWGLHSALERVDWSSVGVWGTSMGAKTIGYGIDEDGIWDKVRAVVLAHGARNSYSLTMPAMFVTSTEDDSSTPASVMKDEYEDAQSSYKVYANFDGLGHTEEDSGIWQARFLACKMLSDGHSCDRINSICSEKTLPLEDCAVEGEALHVIV